LDREIPEVIDGSCQTGDAELNSVDTQTDRTGSCCKDSERHALEMDRLQNQLLQVATEGAEVHDQWHQRLLSAHADKENMRQDLCKSLEAIRDLLFEDQHRVSDALDCYDEAIAQTLHAERGTSIELQLENGNLKGKCDSLQKKLTTLEKAEAERVNESNAALHAAHTEVSEWEGKYQKLHSKVLQFGKQHKGELYEVPENTWERQGPVPAINVITEKPVSPVSPLSSRSLPPIHSPDANLWLHIFFTSAAPLYHDVIDEILTVCEGKAHPPVIYDSVAA